jgi:hypothetical protein
VAIDDKKKNVVFVEIKWTSKKRDCREIEKVIENSSLVKGLDKYSKKYIMISKSGFNDRLEMENCEFWSAENLLDQLFTGVDKETKERILSVSFDMGPSSERTIDEDIYLEDG